MASPHLRTSDIAKALGVHINTVRLYESRGFLPPIPRGQNGYRQYSAMHLEQARLAYLTLRWPYLGGRSLLIDLVKSAAQADFGRAMALAYRYLAQVRVARTQAEVALEFLERWAAGQAAAYLNVTADMLRNWERNGLIKVPRDPSNQFDRARAYLYRVELAFRLNNHDLAQASLTAATSLALAEDERAAITDEVAYVAELVHQKNARE